MNSIENIKNKIISLDEFLVKKKSLSGKIVFTNGCFDILHRGHIELLARASDFGSHLIVGLNSDASVSRLKGKNRPVQDESSRSMILASMQFVDYVIVFTEDTPAKLIDSILPDVLIKGGDYKPEEIVGYQTVKKNSGEVYCLDFVEGYSSSSIIQRIK